VATKILKILKWITNALKKVPKFKYLGSTITEGGKNEEDKI